MRRFVRIHHVLAPVIPLLVLFARPAVEPLGAQQSHRMGSFRVEVQSDSATGEDRSYAFVEPNRALPQDEEGRLMWACGGDAAALSAGVRLEAFGADGSTKHVLWGFDHEEPDTLLLEGEEDSALWYVGDEDLAQVTLRSQVGRTLTVQMLGDSVSGPGTQYTYTLTGLDSALVQLGCSVSGLVPEALAGRKTLRSIPQRVPVTSPRPMNIADIRRYLERNYPASLRDSTVQGLVTTRFRVLENGRADSASIQIMDSTHEDFNDVAIGAVRVGRFRPATAYGQPVKSWIEIPFQFSRPPD